MMFKKISQNFVKSPLKFCLISQILVHSLWHVCKSPNASKFGVNWPFGSAEEAENRYSR